jgi:hypothetical protein
VPVGGKRIELERDYPLASGAAQLRRCPLEALAVAAEQGDLPRSLSL